MSLFSKDPQAVLDYRVDWSAWLATVPGDTINGSTWVVPAGLVEGTGVRASSFDGTSTTVWLSGGDDGGRYEVVNRITTAGGRSDDRTLTITVQHG